jgi:hypothetical protein
VRTESAPYLVSRLEGMPWVSLAAASALFCAPAHAGATAALAGPGAGVRVEAVEVEERVLYHSPETPGYTAWVGLWELPDGTVQCDFEEITKPADKQLRYTVVLETRDGARSWTRVPGDFPAGVCRGMAVLADGTMVRPVQSLYCREGWSGIPEDPGGYVQRSADGGRTWCEPIYLLPPQEYCAWPTLIRPLRDGRLVLFAGCSKRKPREAMLKTMVKMMFVSADQGRSWGAPLVMMPEQDGVCEESDFCEVSNGDLFWIHRAEVFTGVVAPPPPLAFALPGSENSPNGFVYYDRLKSFARKTGDSFVPERPSRAGVPHSGFPCVLLTREGVILHLATGASHWSADEGQTLNPLLAGDKPLATQYYPKALQLADGRILCVSHIGTDNGYGARDMAIVQQTFRLQVTRTAQ